jgi:hypothetical protein
MDRKAEKQFRIDNAFGWQVDRPVFVKTSFSAFGKTWGQGEEFNWINQHFRKEDWEQQLHNVHNLYASGFIRHNSAKEQTNKVGDRLNELNSEQLRSLVTQLNAIVKNRTSSAQEFGDKKCKQSKIDDKQRGLIRQWLRRNTWATDEFYTIRDTIIG